MTDQRQLLSYFNLTQLPFTKELPVDQLQLLPSVERNLAAASLLVDTKGIGAITGKPGTGKSCLLRLLQHRLPRGLYRTFYLCHSSVGTVEFYTHLADLFGLQPSYRRAAMFRDLKQHILSLNNSSHVHPTVILCGSEHLTRKFGLSMLEALASSITVTISVDTLSADESASFLDSRLRACGATTPIFTKSALTLLHQASGGTLRTLGIIANSTLLQAYVARSPQVETEHVQQVIQR